MAAAAIDDRTGIEVGADRLGRRAAIQQVDRGAAPAPVVGISRQPVQAGHVPGREQDAGADRTTVDRMAPDQIEHDIRAGRDIGDQPLPALGTEMREDPSRPVRQCRDDLTESPPGRSPADLLRLQDGDRSPVPAQVIGAGKAGDAGADDRHIDPISGRWGRDRCPLATPGCVDRRRRPVVIGDFAHYALTARFSSRKSDHPP